MTTDRELLELAAKAAGIVYDPSYGKGFWVGEYYSGKEWNPLTDDGDALRLAVKLGITVDMHLERVRAYADEMPRSVEEFFGADPYAATRCAIVRAAAAIGQDAALQKLADLSREMGEGL